MSAIEEGYLVVLKSVKENPGYKGLYRMPYYSEEEAKEGFLDPYIFGDYLDDDDELIRNISLAHDVLERFADVELPGTLEIIYARAYKDSTETPLHSLGYQFLGYDVACPGRPFWSIVADFPSEASIQMFLDRLNEHGLFNSVKDAREYLETYRSQKLPDYDAALVIWEIYLVE